MPEATSRKDANTDRTGTQYWQEPPRVAVASSGLTALPVDGSR